MMIPYAASVRHFVKKKDNVYIPYATQIVLNDAEFFISNLTDNTKDAVKKYLDDHQVSDYKEETVLI